MKKLSIWTAFTLLFGAAGPGLAQAASDTSLNRIVTQIESMFPSDTDGLVLSVDADTLTLDLRLGQSIKRGDRLHLIRFGEKIVHPTTKKKIGRKETDLGQVEIIEVRRDFSLARLIDQSVKAQPGDGVRSHLKKQLSFLVAPPASQNRGKASRGTAAPQPGNQTQPPPPVQGSGLRSCTVAPREQPEPPIPAPTGKSGKIKEAGRSRLLTAFQHPPRQGQAGS